MEQTAILPSDMDTVQIITEVSEKKRENKIRTRARLLCDEFALGFPRQRKQLSGRSHVPVVRFTRPVTASTADSLVSGTHNSRFAGSSLLGTWRTKMRLCRATRRFQFPTADDVLPCPIELDARVALVRPD
jgi:hypothetical protein